MKVTLVNHSDTLGGASVVTYRLLKALRAEGVDARLLVKFKSTDDPYVETIGSKLAIKLNFLAEHLRIFLRNGFSRKKLFKASIASDGLKVASHPLVKDADIVVLSWVNQGMISFDEIKKIEAPLVWTMHDMWNCTGVCHHAGICEKFKKECNTCEILNSKKYYDLAWQTQTFKNLLYIVKPIHFVAVSSWLAEKSRESKILKNRPISVIPNAFPVNDFHAGKKENIIVMGAACLDDDVKNFPKAIAALNGLAETRSDFKVLFFGILKDSSILNQAKFPYKHLGMISDIPSVYVNARVVLSTSHYETLPGTIVEGMASGCIPVTTGNGGQRDIVDHLSTGYIADDTIEDVTRGLNWALDNTSITTEQLVNSVTEKFSAQKIARQYIKLFEELIAKYDK